MMYKQGFAQKVIAETINKDKSVVSRELKRNRNDKGEYTFTHAQMLVDVRKERLSKERTFTGEVKNRVNRYSCCVPLFSSVVPNKISEVYSWNN